MSIRSSHALAREAMRLETGAAGGAYASGAAKASLIEAARGCARAPCYQAIDHVRGGAKPCDEFERKALHVDHDHPRCSAARCIPTKQCARPLHIIIKENRKPIKQRIRALFGNCREDFQCGYSNLCFIRFKR